MAVQTKILMCGHCGNKTVFKKLGECTQKTFPNYTVDEDGEMVPSEVVNTTWSLWSCQTCSCPTLEETGEWCQVQTHYPFKDSGAPRFGEEYNCMETGSTIVYPLPHVAPDPVNGMPENVHRDYTEASDVLAVSPRSSAALLRLALQKLCIHLGQPGKDLNTDIGALVKAGLKPQIQQALDIVRVIGNNAVHPGELDLSDDQETALTLFTLLNLIVEEMIILPTQINTLYERLPGKARKGIEKRDGSTS